VRPPIYQVVVHLVPAQFLLEFAHPRALVDDHTRSLPTSATPTTSTGASRRETHRKGHGSPLLAAALAVGIDFRVVRTWPGTDRHFERKLQNRHGSRLCPSWSAVPSSADNACRCASLSSEAGRGFGWATRVVKVPKRVPF
jgi:hypothetical protein